jgi:hypothetical protein
MDLRFVDLKAILLDAEAKGNTVELDGCIYWPKRQSDGWYLEGRKCSSRSLYDEDFEDGDVYRKFENVEYYG